MIYVYTIIGTWTFGLLVTFIIALVASFDIDTRLIKNKKLFIPVFDYFPLDDKLRLVMWNTRMAKYGISKKSNRPKWKNCQKLFDKMSKLRNSNVSQKPSNVKIKVKNSKGRQL